MQVIRGVTSGGSKLSFPCPFRQIRAALQEKVAKVMHRGNYKSPKYQQEGASFIVN